MSAAAETGPIAKHTEQLCLELLGVQLALRGNCPPLMKQARACFGRYEISRVHPQALQLSINPRGNLWEARFEGRTETLDLESGWPRIDDLLQILIERERNDLAFIHGCCVSHRGLAAVLVGATTSGKTTLALALQNAGCTMLAEDIVPLSLAPAEACYYRTGIAVRPHTKHIMKAQNADVAYGSAAQAEEEQRVPVRWLFFLQPPLKPADSTVSVAQGLGQYDKIMRLCYGQNAPARLHPTTQLRIRHPASFEQKPKLTECSTAQALSLFFKHLHPGPAPAASCLPALAGFLTQAKPLLLYPGFLDQTVSLVMNALSSRNEPKC